MLAGSRLTRARHRQGFPCCIRFPACVCCRWQPFPRLLRIPMIVNSRSEAPLIGIGTLLDRSSVNCRPARRGDRRSTRNPTASGSDGTGTRSGCVTASLGPYTVARFSNPSVPTLGKASASLRSHSSQSSLSQCRLYLAGGDSLLAPAPVTLPTHHETTLGSARARPKRNVGTTHISGKDLPPHSF